MKTRPLVSIISTNYNHGKFLKNTVESVLAQTYDNIEHILVDGGSTDQSIEIARQYPNLKIISERDEGSFHAFTKGLKIAKGSYIMQCAITDGYLDSDWIKKCVEKMEADREVSLVWGLPREMSETGELGKIAYPQFSKKEPLQKQDFFYYWLTGFFWLPEGNFCVRKNIFERCFPVYGRNQYFHNGVPQFDPWLDFNRNFHEQGFLPFFIRSVANFGRVHGGQKGQGEANSGLGTAVIRQYYKQSAAYRSKVLSGKIKHIFQDGLEQPLLYEFSRFRFFARHLLTPAFLVGILRPRMRQWIKSSPLLIRIADKLKWLF